ncbi:hypothetical protein [Clostridium sporogenes]|uniref:hypothetical protein n=1 Tax=Clostridium sporogenes TaxID=1509 RepID=UPI000AAD12F3|nr:hypothetical protein [Clostridium sporogenes]
MNTYTMYSNKGLNWNAKGEERILQNVANLLNTYTHEVSYNRKMGRNLENIDKPLDIFIARVLEETYDLLEEYETRVNIQDIEYIGLEEGIPVLKVVLEIGEGN